MNWLNHPTLYQLTHWWHWLAYGQNAAAIQALAAIIAASAAIAAGIFAARAYRATLTQLHIAREQLALVRAQFETERLRFDAERRRAARAARALFTRMSAEEEATRPRFRNTSGYSPAAAMQTWEFMNYGTSAATDVTVSSADGAQVLTHAPIVGSGGILRFQTSPRILDADGVLIQFKTDFGSRWQTVIRLDGSEDVRAVIRNYEPDEDGIEPPA